MNSFRVNPWMVYIFLAVSGVLIFSSQVKAQKPCQKQCIAESADVLFFDGFESYPLNAEPGSRSFLGDFESAFSSANRTLNLSLGGWEFVNSGGHVVVNTSVHSGTKSLQLPKDWKGYYGMFQRFSPRSKGHVWVDFFVMLPPLTAKQEVDSFSFYVNDPGLSKNHDQAAVVRLQGNDSRVLLNGKMLEKVKWTANTWIRVTVDLDMDHKQVTAYLNEKVVGQTSFTSVTSVKSIYGVGFFGKHVEVYGFMDDLTVRTSKPF